MKSSLPSGIPADPVAEARAILYIGHDESVLWAAHPDPKGYELEVEHQGLWKQIIYFIGPIVLFVAGMVLEESHPIASSILIGLGFFAAVVISIILKAVGKIGGKFTWNDVLYVITDQRIIVHNAVGAQTKMAPLETISTVEMERKPKESYVDFTFHDDFSSAPTSIKNNFFQQMAWMYRPQPIRMKAVSRPEQCYMVFQNARRKEKGNEQWRIQ